MTIVFSYCAQLVLTWAIVCVQCVRLIENCTQLLPDQTKIGKTMDYSLANSRGRFRRLLAMYDFTTNFYWGRGYMKVGEKYWWLSNIFSA